MTVSIFLTLVVIVLTLVAFIREWAAPDVLAMSILCLLVALGLVDSSKMTEVFKNEAPLTIAALFIIGGALENSGAVNHIGELLKGRLSGNVRVAVLAFSVITAFFSAWMNNTAVVAILMPVTLGFARSKNIAASRLLMPLSYCSILGGCCTLIGTSTNLLVSGALREHQQPAMSMFELAPVGIPLSIAGIGYLVIVCTRWIPERASIAGSLEMTSRTTPLYHVLVGAQSEFLGRPILDVVMAELGRGVHVMEVRRGGGRLMLPLSEIRVQKNDRWLVALHRRGKDQESVETLFERIGATLISTVEGILSELVVKEESSLLGFTLVEVDFRQRYNSVVLALHRGGLNITKQMADVDLEVGDTMLVITAKENLEMLGATKDFVMTDTPESKSVKETRNHRPLHVMLAWSVLLGVVGVACVSDLLHGVWVQVPVIPIHYAAMVGALVLLWTRVMSPREAYASIDWQVLLMLYGLLGLGMAMQNTGTASWLAKSLLELAQHVVSADAMPMIMLWLIFLLTLVLTEVLSNNATAVMMIPIVLTMAEHLGVSPRPYIIAVTLAASAAFALPMGYQTHMMIYGPGGYRFTDFLRVGIPLNVLCWVVSCSLIPWIWPFHP